MTKIPVFHQTEIRKNYVNKASIMNLLAVTNELSDYGISREKTCRSGAVLLNAI